MHARPIAALVGAIALVAAQAVAQPDPRMNEPMPPEVMQHLQDDMSMCTSNGGKVSGIENYVRFADFNADKRTDYLLDSGALVCSNAVSLYCGQLGCSVTAYVSQPKGGYKSGLDLVVFEAEIKHVGDRDIVAVSGQTLSGGGLAQVSSQWSYVSGAWKKIR